MPKEPILSIQQLRESIFENRTNKTSICGIIEYFKRNHHHYTLEETFEVNTMCVGCLEIFHDEKKSFINN